MDWYKIDLKKYYVLLLTMYTHTYFNIQMPCEKNPREFRTKKQQDCFVRLHKKICNSCRDLELYRFTKATVYDQIKTEEPKLKNDDMFEITKQINQLKTE